VTDSPWKGLIDSLGDGVLIVDPLDFSVVDANRQALVMLGLARKELLGRPVVDFAVTPEDLCFWEDAAAGLGTDIDSSSVVRRADGTILPVRRRVNLARFGTGQSAYLAVFRDLSEEQRVEEEFERLVAELRATLDSTADAILVVDPGGRIGGYNNRFAELWGLPMELLTERDDPAVFSWMADAVVDRTSYLERLGAIARDSPAVSTDLVILRVGKVFERVSVPQQSRGQPIGRVFSFRDITRQLHDEARLQLAAKVFERSLDAIFVTDSDYRVVACNPACVRLTGYSSEALRMLSLSDLLYAPEAADGAHHVIAESRRLGFWEGEIWYRRTSGSGAPGLVSVVQLEAPEKPNPVPVPQAHAVVFIRDLSERFAAKKRIDELAYNDALTGLPNRALLNQRIQYALGIASRERIPLAVLILDLDRFKQINDSLGHLFGDRVLVEVAARLRACLRAADTAARLGGDEFVLLLHDTDTRGAEVTARRILEALSESLSLDSMKLSISCSIGIALYPEDGTTLDELIKNAEAAMYRAKEHGRSGFRFYQPQMNVDVLSRMKLEQAMRQGLAAGNFRLHYQPQVALPGGRFVGAEALLRWNDPELGEVAPGRFIPVAEESGFITALGDWVIRSACRQARIWVDQGLELVVAVNVSALQFHQADFVDSVRRVLAEEHLPADRIEVELTESILVRDADDALNRLKALADLGVRLSIDDFGTGYSSLTYLKRFPIQKLKIDRGFVRGLPNDESDAAIARAIVNLGQALRLQTIAEGVETAAQRDFLHQLGCNEFQGFLCSPAVPAEEFARLYFRSA
jgi:diguanylate cyclase (GGDEF)-like protein/PAS domain S-box-containing protein